MNDPNEGGHYLDLLSLAEVLCEAMTCYSCLEEEEGLYGRNEKLRSSKEKVRQDIWRLNSKQSCSKLCFSVK